LILSRKGQYLRIEEYCVKLFVKYLKGKGMNEEAGKQEKMYLRDKDKIYGKFK
jgi:hypothetical protein